MEVSYILDGEIIRIRMRRELCQLLEKNREKEHITALDVDKQLRLMMLQIHFLLVQDAMVLNTDKSLVS